MSSNKANHKVFVYGSLKDGHWNNDHYLNNVEGVRFIGRCQVVGPYELRDIGSIPCVTKMEDAGITNAILGEVYEVPDEVMDCLDILEGHPNWYKREEINTPFKKAKKAWCYFMPESQQTDEDRKSVLDNGCWNPSTDELEWLSSYGIESTA